MSEPTRHISVEEWLASLEHLQTEGPDGAFTVQEIAKQTGRSIDWVKKYLRRSAEDGQIVISVVSVTRRALDGRLARVPAYRITCLP